jgi:hypothetical protein
VVPRRWRKVMPSTDSSRAAAVAQPAGVSAEVS